MSARIVNDLADLPPLGEGSHDDPQDGACIMEAVAYVAGDEWSDHPACACPVISAFLRSWNDALPDEERDWLVDAMNAERASKAGHASHSIWRGLADPRVLALALVYFGTSAGLYTLGIWAPQIIQHKNILLFQNQCF